jgi:membrane protease YdiL (CAAX protease family)
VKEPDLSHENQTPPVALIPRSMEIALFLTGGLWALAARTAADHSADGFAARFQLNLYEPLLAAAFLVFLLLTGFAAIHWIATHSTTLRGVNALPLRPTAVREWGIGTAVGWALLVATTLPMMLAGDLHPHFWFQPRAFGLALLSLLTLLVLTLAQEAVFRGYLFGRLIRALGPTLATLSMSLIYATVSKFHPQATPRSVLVAFLMSLLFSLAYLRTHALWLPWGLHFAWSACTGVLFGLPLGGSIAYNSIVDTSSSGSSWLTGGLYGPEGSLVTAVVALVTMGVLYALTRDLAWAYTHPPIIAAGYPMDVAPPAEHTKMEQAAQPAPLVQILSTTPSASSTMPVIDEHLRSNSQSDS